MKKILKAVLIGYIWFMYAQSQTILTLDQCLSLAREYSPRLRTVQNIIRSTELAHDEILTTRLPQLRLTASPIYAPFGKKFGYDPALSNGGQILGEVVLQQSLYDGGIRSLKLDQNTIELERLSQEYRLSERDLTFSVKQLFIETLRSQQEIQLEQESVQQLTDYLDLVKRLYDGGSASYTDVLKTELQLSSARISYQKASNEFAVNKYSLAELIGNAIDTSFNIQGSLDTARSATIDSLISMANLDSIRYLELSIADLELRSGILDIQMTQREHWPVVSLAADAGYANSGENIELVPADRYSALGFSLGIVLDIPLINWGAINLRVQQKQAAVDNLRLESNLLQRSIRSETKRITLQLLRSRERLQAIRLSLKSAEENFLLTKSKFVGGGVLSMEVLSAQQLLTEIRLSELQTLADIQLLSAKLEQLTTH